MTFTIDPTTLLFLKLRLRLLWKRARLHPLMLALLVVGVASGCVPATRFEEAQSAAQVEMEGRRRAEFHVQQLQAENEALRRSMQKQGEVLEEREQALAEAKLDGSMQGKQREQAEGLVEQLRGELARVGGHLQSFRADQRSEEERGRALAILARDIALCLPEPLASGEYALEPEGLGLSLRVPREQLLAEDGALVARGAPTLQAVARVLSLHPEAKLVLDDSGAPGDAIAVSAITGSLGEQGVASERFVGQVADDTQASAPISPGEPRVVTFGFTLP